MKENIGFIGCGKMAQAMIGGILKSKQVDPSQIIASAAKSESLQNVKKRFSIQVTLHNNEVAAYSDILFLAVPPNMYNKVIEEIRSSLKKDGKIVTIAAGITIEKVQEAFKSSVKVIRTMPNTPSLVQEGVSAMCINDEVSKDELQQVKTLFETFGMAEVISEDEMDAIPAISGSSPAYVYMMIEAMADGGVQQGLSRELSYRLASQAVMGAAKMVLDTGLHPGVLKDQVCSPGGATIKAVSELEQQQFRGAIQSAMEKCSEKVHKLGGK